MRVCLCAKARRIWRIIRIRPLWGSLHWRCSCSFLQLSAAEAARCLQREEVQTCYGNNLRGQNVQVMLLWLLLLLLFLLLLLLLISQGPGLSFFMWGGFKGCWGLFDTLPISKSPRPSAEFINLGGLVNRFSRFNKNNNHHHHNNNNNKQKTSNKQHIIATYTHHI